jgi:hypothetical protein
MMQTIVAVCLLFLLVGCANPHVTTYPAYHAETPEEFVQRIHRNVEVGKKMQERMGAEDDRLNGYTTEEFCEKAKRDAMDAMRKLQGR